MLKGINPILRGELLKRLDEMGHGETFALVDKNFASYRYGVPVIDLGAIDAAQAAEALFSVFPLDQYTDSPLVRMAYDDDSALENDAHKAVYRLATESADHTWPWTVMHRPEFYEAVTSTSLIVRCLEGAPYACFIFQKGVI